jgi:hypothetical protein
LTTQRYWSIWCQSNSTVKYNAFIMFWCYSYLLASCYNSW